MIFFLIWIALGLFFGIGTILKWDKLKWPGWARIWLYNKWSLHEFMTQQLGYRFTGVFYLLIVLVGCAAVSYHYFKT